MGWKKPPLSPAVAHWWFEVKVALARSNSDCVCCEDGAPGPVVPPVLVIGLGNILRGDDGIGQRLMQEVQREYAWLSEHVQCVDGGTRGVALLELLGGREAVIVLDSIACGKDPGEVSVLDGTRMTHYQVARAGKSHEGNAAELLCAAELAGVLPERVFLVTVEPASSHHAPGLSESVARAIPEALAEVSELVDSLLAEVVQTATA